VVDQKITLKPGLSAKDQDGKVQNRWHPDIAPVAEMKPGDEILIETIGYDDRQLRDDDTVDDVKALDLSRPHPITGPVAVKGAEPGDFLVVDILDIESSIGVGYSAHGGVLDWGILNDLYPEPFKSVWYMDKKNFAVSRHIPGVTVSALPHPGVIGTAPSQALLEEWNRRESPFYKDGRAAPPNSKNALPAIPRIAKTAARTVPPRENWGNVDIKDITIGAKLFLPVFVKGGNFSVGDLHFAEGDGEFSWNAIEMDGRINLRVGLWKGGHKKYPHKWPLYQPGTIRPQYSRFLCFAGYSVEDGKQHFLDPTVATRESLRSCIEFLNKLGFSGPQAYTLLSVCGMELRTHGYGNIPTGAVGLHLPLDVFDKKLLSKVSDLLEIAR
jgi:formamidase